MRSRPDIFSTAGRILVADGAMGTMLQAFDLGLDDFDGYARPFGGYCDRGAYEYHMP